MADLNTAQAQLDEKEKELNEALALYDSAISEKQCLIEEAEICKTKLETAAALINGLADEKERWTEQSKEFKSQIEKLVGDVLLCTGFLSYQGPFNQDFRNLLAKDWQKLLADKRISFTANINVVDYLTNSTQVKALKSFEINIVIEMLSYFKQIGKWRSQGLPSDDLSIQNAIIVTKATRYPLLVDPQGQGKAWIKNLEANNELQVKKNVHFISN